MIPNSDASLKGKVKALAKKHGLRPQEILQMYLFERLLKRLEQSRYADKFILKGGLLIASLTGIAQRTTMDMDATVIGMSMKQDAVERAIRTICSTPVDDDMLYEFDYLEPIRKDLEYANWRAHIRAKYGKIDAPIKMDITTGDKITPSQIAYRYPLMFSEECLTIMSYPLATVLAEKLETILQRGTGNTRGRDFYDIYILTKLYGETVAEEQLKSAFRATAEKRGSLESAYDFEDTLREIRESTAMRDFVWKSYVESAPYATGIDFDETINATLELARKAI